MFRPKIRHNAFEFFVYVLQDADRKEMAFFVGKVFDTMNIKGILYLQISSF